MGSLPTPATITANTKPTAANFNTYRDALQQLQGGTPTGGQGALDFFSAVQATAQSGLTINTFVAITFATTSEVIDSAAGHDPASNSSRYTPKVPGYCEVSGAVWFAGSASGTRRLSRLAKNGTVVDGSGGSCPPLSTNNTCAPVTTSIIFFNGTTDYVEMFGFADYATWGTVVNAEATSRLNVRWLHS